MSVKKCSECDKVKPINLFVDERQIERNRCIDCRKYHRQYEKEWLADGRGSAYLRGKRQRTLARPVQDGFKVCKRCVKVKQSKEFVNSKGAESPHCHECRRYAAEWRVKRRRRLSAEELDEQRRKERARARVYRDKVLAHYGLCCACCGESQKEFLAIDHIEGGGGKERKKVGGGSVFYSWLIGQGFPAGYRTLCHNCNMAIAFYGVCPHQKR